MTPADRHYQQERQRNAQALAPADIQIVRHRTAAQNQTRPGNAAIENVGLEHVGKRPALQMLYLDRCVEPDAPAGRLQPGAKFDVFNGGPAVAFIKTTMAQECFP